MQYSHIAWKLKIVETVVQKCFQCIITWVSSEEIPPKKVKKSLEDDITQPSTSTKYVLKALPKTIRKNKDQESPLPNPFKLPKKFIRETTTAFTSTLWVQQERNLLMLQDA